MKKALRILAWAFALGSLGFWAEKGANRGWTRTNIKHESPDPVTGLSGVTYEKGFIPGLDFLGGAALAAGIMAGVSRLIKNNKNGK